MDSGVDQSAPLRNWRNHTNNSYLEQTKICLLNKSCQFKICNILVSSAVRSIFILEAIFCIYYTTEITKDRFYLFLIALIINIIIDSIFVSFSKSGREYYWFSLVTFLFSIIVLTSIWSLVFEKYQDNDVKCSKNFNTNSESAFWKSEFKNICSFLEIIVSLFMFSLAIGRFLLPQAINRSLLLGLLVDSLTNSADSVEMFSYIDEPLIKNDFGVVYIILWLFSLSTLQYSFSLAARKKRYPESVKFERFLEIVFGTEIWSLLLICLTMDLPFFLMRFYILVQYQSTTKNYTLYFFVAKNFLLVVFEIYKIILIVIEELIGYEDNNDYYVVSSTPE